MFWRGGMTSGFWNRTGWFHRGQILGQNNAEYMGESIPPTGAPSGSPKEAKDPDFVLPAAVAAGALGIAALVTVLSGAKL